MQKKEWPNFNKNLISKINKVLSSGKINYTNGPFGKQFENNFSKFVGNRYSVAICNGTAALEVAIKSLGLPKNSEIIVSARSFFASASCIINTGHKPIFADVELSTQNISIKEIKKKISKKTKAICVVHFLGVPVDMEKINLIAKKYKLFVLEDCALSLGASFNKIHTGLLGDAGVFSFYPAKHITTGEGGVLITKNKKLFNRIKLLKSLGINKTFLERKTPGIYDVTEVGFNYRMSEIHASIGVKQIEKINNFIKKRKKNFNFLKKNLQLNKHLYILDSANQKFKNSFYCMNVVLSKKLSKNRMRIIKYLNKRNIGTSIYYPQPVPRMSFYKKKYGYKQSDFLNSSIISDRSISLPVGPHLSLSDLRYISKNLLASVKKFQ